MFFKRSGAIAVVLAAVGAVTAPAQSRDWQSGSKFEAETFFGAMIAGKELARGVNATGGEDLIAKLNHGAALGFRVGIHSALIGLEANLLSASNRVRVNNEFGIGFPNHAERPLVCSGDALLYPFRKSIRAGRFRPYVTSGIGGMLMSADLDNIDDQEAHGRLMWNAGGGVKVFAAEAQGLYFDLRFTNHRLLGSNAIDLRSITVGVGYRF